MPAKWNLDLAGKPGIRPSSRQEKADGPAKTVTGRKFSVYLARKLWPPNFLARSQLPPQSVYES